MDIFKYFSQRKLYAHKQKKNSSNGIKVALALPTFGKAFHKATKSSQKVEQT